MQRRTFMFLLSRSAALQPLSDCAGSEPPIVGYINAAAQADGADLAEAFRQGLSETHYMEGQNVAIEYRWADGHYDKLPQMAAELVARQVAVIAATSTPVALAAKAATSKIPIVFTMGGDPVRSGLVASLSRPGGNATGVTRYNVELGPKRLELLHDVVPSARPIGLLVNPTNPNTRTLSAAIERAAEALGLDLLLARASSAPLASNFKARIAGAL